MSYAEIFIHHVVLEQFSFFEMSAALAIGWLLGRR